MFHLYRAKVAPGEDMTRVFYFYAPVMRGPGGVSFRAGGKLADVAEVGAGEHFNRTIRQGVLYVVAVD